MIVGVLLGLVVGLVVGATLAAWRASARAGSAAAERAALELELARTRAEADHERRAAAERQAAWDEAGQVLAGRFAELSASALRANNEQFLHLAEARLAEARQAATGDLDQRRQAIDQLLEPLRQQLGRYEEGLRRLELDRQEAYAGLREQVRQLATSQDRLQAETRNLVTALRAPATRGRWGELQLRRVVEMAGMLAHCDFDEQVSTATDEGRLRPDVVVRLPGDRQVVVDAKVPLQAFLDANDAADDDARRVHLASHARHLRAHVDGLAKKDYWAQFDRSPEFVVAFVPGDPLLAAALEQDPGLLEHAVASHVLLATPTTLIALLRSVAYGWQQQDLADNAREVHALGRELYKRLAAFGGHLSRTGRSLAGAVEAYNQAVGSLERSVLPQARRFQELGAVGADRTLEPLDQLDVSPRRPAAPELVASADVVPLPRPDAVLPEAGAGGR